MLFIRIVRRECISLLKMRLFLRSIKYESIYLKFGNKGNCVIVGRNADAILKEFDDSLHVFIYGNPSWRLAYISTLYPHLSPNELLNLFRDVDNGRIKYCSYYTKREFGLAENYDLCLCSSSLGVEKCVDIICDIAKS